VQGCKIFAKSVTDPMNLQTLIQAVQAPQDRTEVSPGGGREGGREGGKGGGDCDYA